jgi:hypothetical protein
MPYITRDVDIYIDLDDFSDDEISREYEDRGLQDGTTASIDENQSLLLEIYALRAQGKDFDSQLKEYFWNVLGRIV